MRTATIPTPLGEVVCVEVPEDANELFINKVGCIRYQHGFHNGWSASIEPTELGFYATKDNCTILGTITRGEVQFDCSGLVSVTRIESEHQNYKEVCDQALLSLLSKYGVVTEDKKIVVVLKLKQ